MRISSRSRYSCPEVREKLKLLLVNEGFYVHQHAYDYLVMFDEKIVCTIHLLPLIRKVQVVHYTLNPSSKEHLAKIIDIIKMLDREVEVEIKKSPREM